jgi:hypothetical protein
MSDRRANEAGISGAQLPKLDRQAGVFFCFKQTT